MIVRRSARVSSHRYHKNSTHSSLNAWMLVTDNEPAKLRRQSHTSRQPQGFVVLSLGRDRLGHALVFVVGEDEKHSKSTSYCLVLSYTRTRSIVVAIDPTLAFQTRPVHVQHAAAESLLGGVRSSNKLDVTFAHIARCIARCMMRLR